MAATDQHYRSQRILDIVFGATCLVMLLSLIWMFAQDYYRPFKVEARDFRDVEEAIALRELIQQVPGKEKTAQIEQTESELAAARDAREKQLAGQSNERDKLELRRVKAEASYQQVKADYDSAVSKYNIAVDERNEADEGTSLHRALASEAEAMQNIVVNLQTELNEKQRVLDELELEKEKLKQDLAQVNQRVDDAERKLKNLTDEFDRFAKLAEQKRWTVYDSIRALPVIDGFASPLKIDQITLSHLPIDYNFTYATRFDQCTTCHLGIDRPAYSRQALGELKKEISAEEREKIKEAIGLVNDRREKLGKASVDFSIDDDRLKPISGKELTQSRINEYCVHPRLDLFVGDTSPHPKMKFGCSICHGGQGSATDFVLASHAPNDATQQRRWQHTMNWKSNHYWDFPMLPTRFLESSCVKCHHQMTDLLPHGESVEARAGRSIDAPGSKVLRGYNLVKDNGCFGCHEIPGIKDGRWVGPDLRLEPSPPLDAMTPTERVKATADPLSPPGTLRKVGPSLKRIAEKTNAEWTRRWLESPRDFRPDTKMPHFYNLSNNSPEFLRKSPFAEERAQADFPAAEIHGIAYYLFKESTGYLAGNETARKANLFRQQELQEKLKNHTISEKEKLELDEVNRRLELAGVPVPLKDQLKSADGKVVKLPDWLKDESARKEKIEGKKDASGEIIEMGGRQLFTEKGCLACHKHDGTTKADATTPAVISTADFGPNLSDLAAKIKPEVTDPEARWRWLVQWIMNPNVHFPRTRMPITHLTEDEAARIAAWLMSQSAGEWKQQDPAAPTIEALQHLARVYLDKAMGNRIEGEAAIKNEGLTESQEAAFKLRGPDADELRLAKSRTDESWEDKLKWYVGRKAITQLGCYGCHDIPGFEFAKPVGTPLNDWGKNDPERIAFEDAISWVKNNYRIVAQRDNPRDPKKPSFEWREKDNKKPYEQFFFEALDHHQRDGFLNQKLVEPRSYDYDRLRAWDERLRMPQFRFSRSVVKRDASVEDNAQADRDEAEAREAVMTFVLGLVAEPIPQAYVYRPSGDKEAVVKGKHVLEKFNCASCHFVDAGRYEFKLNEMARDVLNSMAYSKDNSNYASDHREPFKEQNEWTGQLSPDKDRLTITGMPDVRDPNTIRLTEAVRFLNNAHEVRDVPAANHFKLDVEEMKLQILSKTAPNGGTFTDLLVPYLGSRLPLYKDYVKARSALPPPLLREGEKAQPEWLFQFLKNPTVIRPAAVLRMPKFNMSDEDAMTLVNYFAASDRLSNPGGGLDYPYLHVPQRSDSFWREETAEYVERLKKDKLFDERKKAIEEIAGASVNQWEQEGAYATDAYRLLSNYEVCLGCHNVGSLKAKNPERDQGPPLDLSWQRLRPEWTARWIANPDRMISYPNPMPSNFTKDTKYHEFDGTQIEQIFAVRDVLMFFPKVTDLPTVRGMKPPSPMGDKK